MSSLSIALVLQICLPSTHAGAHLRRLENGASCMQVALADRSVVEPVHVLHVRADGKFLVSATKCRPRARAHARKHSGTARGGLVSFAQQLERSSVLVATFAPDCDVVPRCGSACGSVLLHST
eukprot:5544516-Pleurochrysis_carterae.AAC.1